MRDFLGLFFAARPRALQGVLDESYVLLGRHALCGAECAFDGGAAAILSGRLRNAAALRERLVADGATIRPGGGSALLLAAYRLWGEDCVSRLEGPVCCAVIDQDAGFLLLSRDRMGEGSLFYATKGGSVAFSSRVDALLDAPCASRLVNREGVCELFGLGPARTPGRTPFQDIHALRPGCMLIARAGELRVERYFALRAREHEDGEARTVETVRALVEEAVGAVAPLSPMAMLSGGLDSTVLTALLARRIDGPVHTWSVDYEGNEAHFASDNVYQPEPDAPWVREAARVLGASHTAVVLSQRSLAASLDEAADARGLPGMADVDASLLLFARAMASGGRYALSGECGDEVFGGYPWFRREDLIAMDGFPWSGSLPLRESILRPEIREKLNLAEYVADRYSEARARHRGLPGEDAREARLRLLQNLCFDFFMPNLQERAARMCAASGVTVLTPYCDDRLAAYVYNVPWPMKAMRGCEKGLLRAAMEDLLPEGLLWRKKSPYPKTYHPEYGRLVKDRLRETLRDPAAPVWQLVDRDALTKLADGPLSPSETPWFGQLMTGVQLLGYVLQVNRWMLRQRVELNL